MMGRMPRGGLEIRGPADGLLDDELLLTTRGATAADVTWKARLRDDDGRVWRAVAPTAGLLSGAWEPARRSGPPLAALRSLRPVAIDVRVEAADGRTASRTVTRRLLGEGVQRRRWRNASGVVLHLPAQHEPVATVIVHGDDDAPLLAAALLASRGVLALLVPRDGADAAAAELRSVPRAGEVAAIVDDLLPPGVPAVGQDIDDRARAWDQLLTGLGAVPARQRSDG